MGLTLALAAIAVLSVLLLAWQVLAAARFPLHQSEADLSFKPRVLVLKPLKGCDAHTAECLRSWLRQDYAGQMAIRFGVAEATDPVCEIVRALLKEFPGVDAELVLTPEMLGPNAKLSNLTQLYRREAPPPDSLICISDADVRVPANHVATAIAPLRDRGVGLVNSLYTLANPGNLAMEIEGIAVNADFWSQVLQSNMLKPQDFALGAVMVTPAAQIEAIGGLGSLVDYLADDYQLGNRIAKLGLRIVLTRAVVECWEAELSFRQVWRHQLRWARTIRVCQPLPYFFSILNNVTFWATAFAASASALGIYRIARGYPLHVDALWLTCCLIVWGCCVLARFAAARYLVQRLTGRVLGWKSVVTVAAKDLVQAGIWIGAHFGNTVAWRGVRYRVLRGGKLVEDVRAAANR